METIQQAKSVAREAMAESLQDALPSGADVADVASGHYDWGAALDSALTLPQPLVDLLGGLSLNLTGGPDSQEQREPAEAPDGVHDDGRVIANGDASPSDRSGT